MATPTAHTDAQGQNDIDRNVRQYTDLDLFFSKKATSKDISKVTDIQAVKRSIRNLVLTNFYEKPFHPEIGSGITGILFELVSPTTAVVLQSEIRQVVTNFEPRVRLIDIRVLGDIDKNGYYVTIKFQPINTPNPVTIELFLERLR